MFALTLVGLTLAGDCEDTGELSLEARAMMLEGRMEEATDRLDRAADALSCGTPGTSEALAQYFLTEAVRRYLEDDLVAAKISFVAAWHTEPSLWDPMLGSGLRELYDEAIASAMNAEDNKGEILLAELPRGYRGALNGVPTEFPARVESGKYLVQVYHRRTVYYGDIPFVPPGESVLIDPGELPAAKKPVFLIGGGVSALAAGGLAVVALSQTDKMSATTDVSALNQHYTTQRITGYAAYGLAGLAATGIALHFAL